MPDARLDTRFRSGTIGAVAARSIWTWSARAAVALAVSSASGCLSTTQTPVVTGHEAVREVEPPWGHQTVAVFAPDRAAEVTVMREARCRVWSVVRTQRELHEVESPTLFTWVLAGGVGVGSVGALASDDPPSALFFGGLAGAIVGVPLWLADEDRVLPLGEEVEATAEEPVVCVAERRVGIRVSAGAGRESRTDARGVARFDGPIRLRELRVEGRPIDELRVIVSGRRAPAPGAGASSAVPARSSAVPATSSAMPPSPPGAPSAGPPSSPGAPSAVPPSPPSPSAKPPAALPHIRLPAPGPRRSAGGGGAP